MKLRFILFIFLAFAQSLKAQYYVADIKNIDEIKKGSTYVIMKDPNSKNLDQIKDAIKQGWTITDGVQFITPEQISNHLEPENTFITIIADVFYSRSSPTSTRAFPFIELNIFQLNKTNLKENGATQEKDRIKVASFTISTDPKIAANSDQQEVDNWNWDLNGKATNWIPGIIKNNLQGINNRLMAVKAPAGKKDNNTELSALKNDTLYVAEFSLFDYKGEFRKKSENLFSKYDFKYKIIDSNELNNKIMSGEKFYYATFIRSSTANVFYVTGSLTGKKTFFTYQVS